MLDKVKERPTLVMKVEKWPMIANVEVDERTVNSSVTGWKIANESLSQMAARDGNKD